MKKQLHILLILSIMFGKPMSTLNAMVPVPGTTVAHSADELDKSMWVDLQPLLIKLYTSPDRHLWCFILAKLQELNITFAIKRSNGEFSAALVQSPCYGLTATNPGVLFSKIGRAHV